MAKGNNGNLLQHFIECEIAARLTQPAPKRGLHVVFTHGMAPFEPFEQRRTSLHKELDECLRLARASESGDAVLDFPLLRAYRAAGASADSYPNSAELMAAVVRNRKSLMGTICETDPSKQKQLAEQWADTGMSVHKGSWREREAELKAPEGLDHPWLFSMDPFSFSERRFSEAEGDGYLDRTDLYTVRTLLAGYRDSGKPGALCVFCYGLRPPAQNSYRAAVQRAFGGEDTTVIFVETRANGGNMHVGALVSRDADLLDATVNAWADLSAKLKL